MSGLTTGPDAVGPAGDEGPGAPLRVVHVLDSFTAGGAQAVAVQLGAWLAARGAQVHLLGAAGPLATDARRALGPSHVHVRPGTVAVGGSVGRFVAGLRALDRTCREVRPHVLHAHQRREALQCLLVGARHGVPVVEHAHTFLPRPSLRALSFRSAAVFAVSDHVGAMVADRFGRRDGVLVVGNAPARTSDRPVLPAPPPGGRPLRILGLGRLVEQKDPLRFVRVVAAAARIVDVEAVWHGDGPLLDEARALASRLGAPVVFAGHADDVPARIDAADALLMTSAWEGLPLVVLEAFARHRPVVATAASGAPGALGGGRAVVVPDDADDETAARLLTTALADRARTTEQVSLAAGWLARRATPDAVFGPVLRTYDELRRRAAPRGRRP